VAAAITLKPSSIAASGHNLEVVTVHAIWTLNDFLLQFEPSSFRFGWHLASVSPAIRSGRGVPYFQNLFFMGVGIGSGGPLDLQAFLAVTPVVRDAGVCRMAALCADGPALQPR